MTTKHLTLVASSRDEPHEAHGPRERVFDDIEPLDFSLPAELEAHEPPEERGLGRDGVRLMVSRGAEPLVSHHHFPAIVEALEPGDLLVINTSGTLNAALDATRSDGTPLEVHLSTHLPGDVWTLELRLPSPNGTLPFREGRAGEVIRLPAGATATLLAPYATDRAALLAEGRARLWLATLALPNPLHDYLAQHGFPIRYGYVPRRWPGEYYQTVYATEMGSAEMPSAGRAFTPELITRLIARGIQIAPLLLHTGVSSLEDHEPPYEEYYRVPLATARAVNAAHAAHRRVVAVGTTVVRALETVTDEDGTTHPGEGWTPLVITPTRGVRAVQGLLTGLHEPRASHLAMLEAIAGRAHVSAAYHEALRHKYRWHEFGDLHLLLP
ncbi:MAG TPA: S-adenosylmethionine:tRNA ribosyltransferase-isomerase [Ktedonobacterales bacterium]|jgi:S-adenosylmethionine:tRNA ribosyltransferase-isomerase|nr:S-adenosylmethionine:tRNA ribosyltransferase-isomerase [Ktedonobacterales bacterium]